MTRASTCYFCWFSFVACSLLSADDWPMLGRDWTRNAVTDGELPASWDVGNLGRDPKDALGTKPRNIKWSASLGSVTFGAPVVAGGRVYIGTNNAAAYLERYPNEMDLGCLLCFNEADGQFLWQFSAEKLPTGRHHDWPQMGLGSSPLVEGDRLWLVSNRYEVLCLDALGFTDGENDGPFHDEQVIADNEADVVWRYDLIKNLGVSPHNAGMGPNKRCSPSASYQNRIYIVTENGPDASYLKFPAPQAPALVCFEKDTGKVLWTDNSPGENVLDTQVSDPLVVEIAARCQVIVGQGDGWVRAFDSLTGEVIWKFDINFKNSQWVLGGRGTKSEIVGTPVFYKGRVYVGSGQGAEHGEGPGRLVCLDPTKTGDISSQLAVDAARKILPIRRRQAVVAEDNEKAIPNPNSGLIWEYTERDRDGNGKIDFEEMFHRTVGSVAIKDDLLIAADFSGLVHCLHAQTGQVHWTYDMLAACWCGPLIVGNKAVIPDEDGELNYFTLHTDPEIATQEANDGDINRTVLSSVYSPPVFVNDVLYIASRNRLYAIQAARQAAEAKPEHSRGSDAKDSAPVPEKPDAETPTPAADQVRRAPKSVFAPTPHDVVEAMLQAADVQLEDTVIDLGSGDGRIVLAACRTFGAKGIGYEIDHGLVAASRESIRQAPFSERCEIRQEDMHAANLSEVRVVTAYLFPGSLEKLIPQFQNMKEGSLIVTHHYEIPNVEPVNKLTVHSVETGDDHNLYLYQLPLREKQQWQSSNDR